MIESDNVARPEERGIFGLSDPPFAAAASAGLLLVFGMIMVYSATAVPSLSKPDVMDEFHFLKKQAMYLMIGSLAFWLCLRVHYRKIASAGVYLLPLSLALLVLVLVPSIGKTYNGASRWIRFGGFGLQASDAAKLALVIFLAWLMGGSPERARSLFRGTIPALLAIAVTAGLVAVEPDFGTALFLIAAGSITAIAAGVRLRHLLPIAAAGVPAMAYFLYAKFGHIRDRLDVFMNPELDPLGKGHQVKQSLIALGSGGITGCGIGSGRMKLYFLPENFTDFIFSLIGEEAGLAGTLLVLFCFAVLLWAGASIARRARDMQGFVLAIGVTVTICAQAFINIAVVTASVPTKEISLPFVSYGGSSLVCMMAAIGILLNVALNSGTDAVEAPLEAAHEAA